MRQLGALNDALDNDDDDASALTGVITVPEPTAA